MDLIERNPYRVLGVFSNASLKEITANKTKLSRYASVGKSVSFEADMDGVLPVVQRTEESVAKAFDALSLPIDKLKHAFFWFAKGNSIDEIALGHINMGDIEKAKELLAKKETWSSLVNQAVLAFVQEDDSLAIQKIVKLIRNVGGDYLRDFVASVCGDTFQITEKELAHAFMEALLERGELAAMYRLVKANDAFVEDVAYLRKQIMEVPVSRIKAEITKAKKTCADDKEAAYEAGKELMEDTRADLELLKEVREEGDPTYLMIADSLADRILQCGIDYQNYHNSNHYAKVEAHDSVERALELCNYALGIAEGTAEKERCQRNVDQTLKNKSSLAPRELVPYYKRIKKLWDEYKEKPRTMDEAVQLIENCVPLLVVAKEMDDFRYHNWSTSVANKTILTLMDAMDKALKKDASGKWVVPLMKETFREAWRLMLYIEQLEPDEATKNNIINYRDETLKRWIRFVDHYDPDYSEGVFAEVQQVKLDLRTETEIFSACEACQDYVEYLERFPDGKYADEVKQKMTALKEKKDKNHNKKALLILLAFTVLAGVAIVVSLV